MFHVCGRRKFNTFALRRAGWRQRVTRSICHEKKICVCLKRYTIYWRPQTVVQVGPHRPGPPSSLSLSGPPRMCGRRGACCQPSRGTSSPEILLPSLPQAFPVTVGFSVKMAPNAREPTHSDLDKYTRARPPANECGADGEMGEKRETRVTERKGESEAGSREAFGRGIGERIGDNRGPAAAR